VHTRLLNEYTEIPIDREGRRAYEMGEPWIIDSCRTPRGIGKVGKGALAEEHPQRLVTTCAGGGMAPAIIIERI
jgi:hypothetical protein